MNPSPPDPHARISPDTTSIETPAPEGGAAARGGPTPSVPLLEHAGRVLIVDDNPRNVFICEKLLRGHVLATAASGEEALAKIAEFRPDVVLLDIMMPGIDGYETCRRLRQIPVVGTDTKVIMVSARAMVSERLQGYEAGADDYVSKPFNPDELTAKVRVYLRLKTVEEVDRLRSHLITLLHHETRTPMSYLTAAVEMLSAESGLTQHQRDLVNMVDEASRKLHLMLERVTLLSTLRSGAYALQRTPLRVGDLLESALHTLREEAKRRDVELVLETSHPVIASMDLRFPTLVLVALAENAVRHSGRGSRVVVAVGLDGTQAHVRVRDDGRGIDAETMARLGEPFTVPDIGHHSAGTGLGLALARELVLAHEGTIEVASRPGSGTCVDVRWPTLADEAPPQDRAA